MKAARLIRLIPFLTIPLAAMTLAAPASASTQVAVSVAHPAHPAAGSAVAAYLWSESTTQSGSVTGYYSFSTAGAVSVNETSPGVYVASFAGLGHVANKAIVQVSAYGGTDTCAVVGWVPAGANLNATVACFDQHGGQSPSEFDLMVTRPTSAPHGVFDYSFVNKNNGILNSTFNYNSSHRSNKVTLLSTGRYQVTLGGPRTSGTHGTVKVSAYGDEGGDCQLVGWRGSAAGEVVDVDCRTAGGAFQSRNFMVTYAASTNLMGLKGKTSASALAAGASAVYQPVVQSGTGHGARVTIVHLGTGAYQAIFAGSEGNPAFGGDIQVNAVGTKNVHCVSGGWDQNLTPTADVECYTRTDQPVNSPFAIDWTVG